MIIPDINLLVYAYNKDAPHHGPAVEWWQDLMNGRQTIAVPWPFLITLPYSISPGTCLLYQTCSRDPPVLNGVTQRGQSILVDNVQISALSYQFTERRCVPGPGCLDDVHTRNPPSLSRRPVRNTDSTIRSSGGHLQRLAWDSLLYFVLRLLPFHSFWRTSIEYYPRNPYLVFPVP